MATSITPILVADYRKEVGPMIWHYSQIYRGTDPTIYDDQSITSRYVPIVGDIVLHPTNGDWLVSAVSERYIPTLVPRGTVDTSDDVNDTIVVPSSSFSRRTDVLLVDATVTPIRFYINSRIFLNGSQSIYYKIFLGTNVTSTGNSIGAVYNNSGVIISDQIELELAAFEKDVTNNAIKTPKTGYLRELPADGEIVTVVTYASDGRVMDVLTLIVAHENFIVTGSATKIINEITLDTPYISESDSSVIEIPRNMNLAALSLFGIVHYNNGDTPLRLPVNGNKFSILGLNAYTASVDMSSVGITLAYTLGDDEYGVGLTGQDTRSITRGYRIKTLPSDAAYSVKLFVIPVWNSQLARWDLTYMLYDMRRDQHIDVTDLVEMSSTYTFNPDQYNQKQTVQVAINLANVGAQYKYYRPVQVFYINLLKPGESVSPAAYYLLSYSTDVTLGNGLYANRRTNNGGYSLDLSCGQTTVDDYLANVYKNIEVLYTTDVAAPPSPTKFRLRLYGSDAVTEYPIENIINGISGLTGTYVQGGTVIIEFFSETGSDPIELGSLAYPINVIS